MFSFKVNVILITLTTCIITMILCRKNPFSILKRSIRYIFADKQSLVLLVLLFSILAINKLQLKYEGIFAITNYAIYFYRIEGEMLSAVQAQFYNPTLTFVLTYFYVIVFTSMLIVSLFVYCYNQDPIALRVFCLAIMLNYLIAIPFFMFFGVTEVWFIHPKVKFLIPQFYPNFELEYRKMSGLDNSFPSLHTSISITMALVAYHFNYRWFGKMLFACAVVILFSILYLGIHWVADLVAGLLLAFLSVKMATLLVTRRSRAMPKFTRRLNG